jgi:cytosine/adenosine deaminase-related metal-dependent hydrolase
VRLLIEAPNAAVVVEGGSIVPDDGRIDAVLRVTEGELRPGLINAHDHLHRNHYGRLGDPPYTDAYSWGLDIHARYGARIARGRRPPRRVALLRGAWKNLRAGVTTVVHHDAWERDFERDFPIRVARLRSAHSLGFETQLPAPGGGRLAIHLAEGTGPGAAGEVREMERLGLLTRDLLAVHMVGADADGVGRVRGAGVGVVWCPSSNLFLFGRTAPRELLEPGIDVLLGSDSLLTGVGNLLDELRLARRLGYLSDERLLESVGGVAARRLGLPPPSLQPGAPADLILLRRPVLEATAEDVAMVMVGGTVRLLDPTMDQRPTRPWASRHARRA